MGDSLDLDAAQTTAAVAVHSSGMLLAYVIISLTLMVIVIACSAWVAMRVGVRSAAWRLDQLSPPLKLLAATLCLNLLMLQAIGVASVYAHTRVLHASTWEYFQYVSAARLLGTSHAHLFGYTIIYAFLGLLVSMTTATDWTKCLLIAAMVWAGVFDVVSWWGIKYMTPRFEWLAMAAGVLSSTSSIVVSVMVGRSLARCPKV